MQYILLGICKKRRESPKVEAMGNFGGRRNGEKQEKEQRHTGELEGGQCPGRKAEEVRVRSDTESVNVRFGKYLLTTGHCVLDDGDF